MFAFSPYTTSRPIVTNAGSRVSQKFSLNLSFISQPWVLVEAIVVSEIIDRLSPNIMPPMTQPKIMGRAIPDFSATATAMGPTAAALPTDVPVAVAIKPEIIKMPTAKYSDGIYVNPKLTVESIPPMAPQTLAKPPASRKMMHIIMILASPQPLTKVSNLSKKLPCSNKKAAIMPILAAMGAGT